MANQQWSQFTELTEIPAVGDLFAVADISDTTDAGTGTSKKVKGQFAVGTVVNAQTGTSYTVLTTDFRKLVTHTNASPIAVTLLQASATFPTGWYYFVQNRGAGAVTITPTTSTIDGAATLVLNQNEGALIVSDGTNYFTFRGKASGATGVGDVVGPGSATDKAVARFNSTTGKLIQNSGMTCADDLSGEIGYINIPQNSQSAAYTTVLADRGKHIFHPSTDANARTFTIDSNANVPYAVGTAITFVNMTSQVVTIAITSDTMYLAGPGTTGSRSLAQYGVATAIKIDSTHWLISGTGLT